MILRTTALMALTAWAGWASTVTYTLTATASGTLDGTAFTDSLLTITAVANTSTPGTPFSSTVTVGSLSDTFNDEDPYVFDNPIGCGSSCAGFGTVVDDILDVPNSVFATYTLGNPIGPVTDSTLDWWAGPLPDDSGGTLVLSSVTTETFTAVVVSTAVPEPSSVSMLGIGLIAAGIGSRRRLLAGRVLK